jgi:flagellar biosynthesis protein FlhF
MQIRTFRAPTIGHALEQVKRELGADAIILGNKKVAVSPTETIVEVTAAVEPEPVRTIEDNQIKNDIEEIKSFLSLLISSKDYSTQLQLKQPLMEIYHSLLARGLDEKQTFSILRKALGDLDGDYADKRQIIEAFCRQLLDKIKFSRPFTNIAAGGNSPPFFAFVGPTGVGKTTTLAKLAAYLKIKRKLNIGVVSLDTYRIGAVDQLQTYTNILNIPLMVAQNKTEFRQARNHFRQQDAILVDTIGKNFLKREHVRDFYKVFSDMDRIHHFLVLSATAKDNDLRQTIIHFNSLNLHSLVFTKVDETLSHGCMINQLLRFPHPLSYLGIGQRVPEDVELATQKRLLSLLFPSGNAPIGKE